LSALTRTGPLRDAQARHGARWTEVAGMEVAAAFEGGEIEARRLAAVGVGDVSHRRRAGVKGPGARDWLAALGIEAPAQPNSYRLLDDATLLARLGLTEYVLAAPQASEAIARVAAQEPLSGVYPVTRFDAEIVLTGSDVHELLKQTCSFDFESLDPAACPLVMTSVVGVGVTVIALGAAPAPVYRVWCDGSYGGYLWTTLVEVATSLGGGAVGLDALGPLAR
jgi:sarcosine oxidase subunit gamma